MSEVNDDSEEVTVKRWSERAETNNVPLVRLLIDLDVKFDNDVMLKFKLNQVRTFKLFTDTNHRGVNSEITVEMSHHIQFSYIFYMLHDIPLQRLMLV